MLYAPFAQNPASGCSRMQPGGKLHHVSGARACPCLGNEAGEEGVGGDVEGHAQAQVAAALVHLATQGALRHKELRARTASPFRT